MSMKKKKVVKKTNEKRAAFSKFQGMATRGEEKSAGGGGLAYKTIHQNTINSISCLGGSRFVTSGIDGRILFWDLSKNGVAKIKAVGDSLN